MTRTETIRAAAAAVLSESGVDVTLPTPRPAILAMARRVCAITGCHISTAKRHIARAMRRARHPGEAEAQHGGARVGAGRHKIGCECEACK